MCLEIGFCDFLMNGPSTQKGSNNAHQSSGSSSPGRNAFVRVNEIFSFLNILWSSISVHKRIQQITIS